MNIHELVKKSIKEMEDNKMIIIERGDLFDDGYDTQKYAEALYGLYDVNNYLEDGGLYKTAGKFLEQSFFKDETFFMNLFETERFPYLFDLFEY